MRWRALETGRIYVRQNLGDAQILVQQLRTMASSDDWSLANRVIRFGRTLHGTRQYWATQRANLRVMQETLGMPTVLFTLSAADLHWPELYDLLKYYKPSADMTKISEKSKAMSENPHLTDWFFLTRAKSFLSYFFVNCLGFKDYWARIEYQHRGSPHVHGMGWIKDSPDVEDTRQEEGSKHCDDNLQQHAQVSEADGREKRFTEVIQFCDKIVSTWNPSLDENGTGNNPHPQVNPASYRYSDKVGHEASDYAELIVTVQRHAHCSPFYCLSKTQKGEWQCRFGFPKQLQDQTTIVFNEYGNQNF